ncbi:MAG: benzoyl-CoA-dihydrodiol lyase [Gammaproteobacteria bacterium]|nr:benzoyl-CoA-dihydrodiol lyase [Gammaproteobacteria bacterium]
MSAAAVSPTSPEYVTFDRHPDHYAHWRLSSDGAVATLALDVAEDKGLKPGYKLKLNSYDLGVDIELYDALQRIRFEHPQVKVVVITSAKDRMFCSGANIYMLGLSSHAWKVNFCKFTNETRNGIEDSSRHSGLKFLAAVNGTVAGGGYELALACDEILMVDDRSSTVSLPEVPLLGVLPGTGGLTRIIDKRRVRRDLADFFCTTSEGVRGDRAKLWGLVDHIAKPQQFKDATAAHLQRLIDASTRPAASAGIALTPLARVIDDAGIHYSHVDVRLDRTQRTATIIVTAPTTAAVLSLAEIHSRAAAWWPLAMARELDDAILLLRLNELDIGTWILQTRGDPFAVLALDATLEAHQTDWFVHETIGMLRRTFARLDVSSRTLYALLDEGSCFTGTLAELALAADRSFMLQWPDEPERAPHLTLSHVNFGLYPMVNYQSRIQTRFCSDPVPVARVHAKIGTALDAAAALELGLVTFAPDDLDWADEVRLALEERTSLSPDALTGMEASLRFGGAETLETRIFSRLSAWQNWIFIRPNAVGEHGALKVFGTGRKAQFNWERV